MASVLIADTHRPEYLIHKYWSRKPANVIRELIQRHTRLGSLVVDPCCGSGVAVIEAAKLGHSAIGVDLNPVAGLLARTSIRPVAARELTRAWDGLLEHWAPLCREAYTLEDGQEIEHCVHATVAECPQCRAVLSCAEMPKTRGRYACPECDARVNAGIAHSRGTTVVAVYTAARATLATRAALDHQARASCRPFCDVSCTAAFDLPLVANKRVLAYAGMRTSTLFTRRNFSLLSKLAAEIHKLAEEPEIRDALLLLLTSAVASCSRLIAYRDNMKGGGPAWTVPGFWVPPMHLERNPLLHLRARFPKLLRGLQSLRAELLASNTSIHVGDGAEFLRRLSAKGTRADYIFADPPYGDSVPYLEFSQIWNCWLRPDVVDFGREVVVSDRTQDRSRWEEYESRLQSLIAACRDCLGPRGKITLSFNNLDCRAWRALIAAVQASRLWCIGVDYQLPAVVSAKAQFSVAGSSIGDVYATFRHARHGEHYGGPAIVRQRLAEAAKARGGAVSRVTHLRTAAITVLESNIRHEVLDDMDKLLHGLPARTPPLTADDPLFSMIWSAIRDALRSKRSLTDAELWAAVARELPSWLTADPHEIIQVAHDTRFVRRERRWESAPRKVTDAASL